MKSFTQYDKVFRKTLPTLPLTSNWPCVAICIIVQNSSTRCETNVCRQFYQHVKTCMSQNGFNCLISPIPSNLPSYKDSFHHLIQSLWIPVLIYIWKFTFATSDFSANRLCFPFPQASERKMGLKPKEQSSLHELLMEEIRSMNHWKRLAHNRDQCTPLRPIIYIFVYKRMTHLFL